MLGLPCTVAIMRIGALSSCRGQPCPSARSSSRPGSRISCRPAHARMVVRVSTNEAEQPAEDEDYQLRSDLKSVARTMLEGKPLLREDAQEVQEEMERERFFGRIAVLGLGAVLIGERITGKGVVQALDHAVGVPLWEIEPLLGLLVLSLLWGALYPRKQLAPAAQAEAAQATGRNWVADAQVLVRRLACVALAVAIVAETISGKGALALLDIETGVETLSEVEAGAAFLIMLFLTSAEPKPKRA